MDKNISHQVVKAVAKSKLHEKQKRVKFNKILNQLASNVDDCAICLEKMYKDENLQMLNCGHKFHRDCLLNFMKSSPESAHKCPLCRQVDLNLQRETEDVLDKQKAVEAFDAIVRWYLTFNHPRDIVYVLRPDWGANFRFDGASVLAEDNYFIELVNELNEDFIGVAVVEEDIYVKVEPEILTEALGEHRIGEFTRVLYMDIIDEYEIDWNNIF